MKSFYKTFLLLFLNVSFLSFNSFSQQAPGIEWAKCFGGDTTDICYSINSTDDGGFIVNGYSLSNDSSVSNNHGALDYWVVKLDQNGLIQWQNCYGGNNTDVGRDVIQTNDGGYILAGSAGSNNGNVNNNYGSSDYWIVKLDSAGAIIWEKNYGGTNSDVAFNIRQTYDGGFIVTGITSSDNIDVSGYIGFGDFWIVKIDNNGFLQWETCMGGTSDEQSYSIIETLDHGFAAVGYTSSNDVFVNGNHGSSDGWIVKLDSSGNFQWQKCLGGSNTDNIYSIVQTVDSGYVLCGYSNSNDGDITGNHGSADAIAFKLNKNGNIIWEKTLGGSGFDRAYSIIQNNNNYYIIGQSSSNDGDVSGNHGSADMWVVKLDSSSAIIWQKVFGGTLDEVAYAATLYSNNDLILSGCTRSNNGDVSGNHGSLDYWIVKLLPDTITSTFNIQHSAFNINIFPNPSSGIFQITFPSSYQKTNYTIEVINTLGQTVYEAAIKQTDPDMHRDDFNLNVSFLTKGIYLLKISGSLNAMSRILIIG